MPPPEANHKHKISKSYTEDGIFYKQCYTCGKAKQAEIYFYRSKKCKDGYESSCKECVCEYMRKYRAEQSEFKETSSV